MEFDELPSFHRRHAERRRTSKAQDGLDDLKGVEGVRQWTLRAADARSA
jgi:hypothetical protein